VQQAAGCHFAVVNKQENQVASQYEFREQVKDELINAVAYFVERQKLVAQAMTELGLDLYEVAEFGTAAWATGAKSKNGDAQNFVANLEAIEDPYVKKLYQVAKRASERNISQGGTWKDSENNEWRYFLHGGGCRLTNLETGEPIDWDCPDTNSYDKHKFFYHLEWQMTSSERAEKLSFIRNVEKETLKTLINDIAL
jgi:hypothetical protein